MHIAYAVELLDRITDQVIARGIFNEAEPELPNPEATKTRFVARAWSPVSYDNAAARVLGGLRTAASIAF